MDRNPTKGFRAATRALILAAMPSARRELEAAERRLLAAVPQGWPVRPIWAILRDRRIQQQAEAVASSCAALAANPPRRLTLPPFHVAPVMPWFKEAC